MLIAELRALWSALSVLTGQQWAILWGPTVLLIVLCGLLVYIVKSYSGVLHLLRNQYSLCLMGLSIATVTIAFRGMCDLIGYHTCSIILTFAINCEVWFLSTVDTCSLLAVFSLRPSLASNKIEQIHFIKKWIISIVSSCLISVFTTVAPATVNWIVWGRQTVLSEIIYSLMGMFWFLMAIAWPISQKWLKRKKVSRKRLALEKKVSFTSYVSRRYKLLGKYATVKSLFKTLVLITIIWFHDDHTYHYHEIVVVFLLVVGTVDFFSQKPVRKSIFKKFGCGKRNSTHLSCCLTTWYKQRQAVIRTEAFYTVESERAFFDISAACAPMRTAAQERIRNVFTNHHAII